MIRSLLPRVLRFLSPANVAREVDDERFRRMMRNTSAVGFVLVVASEVAPYLGLDFPRDTFGTAVMAAFLAVVAVAGQLRVSRWLLGLLGVLTFGVVGWYVARATQLGGGVHSQHRDAIFVVLAAAHALLLFSAFEFTVVTVLSTVSFAAANVSHGASLASFGVTFFYVFCFYCLALVGIVARTRLQRSERRTRAQLEQLNRTLEHEVAEQVDRIRRAEELGRYLPPQITEQVLAGRRGTGLAQGRRQLTVLCATPFGFLESLTGLPPDQVGPLVNGFVAELTRVAFDHGGVIERFVGPRITVLFGALDEDQPEQATRRAVEMALDTLRVCNVLLRQWEAASGTDEGGQVRLRMAIGISAGTCVVGTFGSERRIEYSALGEPMVRAHRLASLAIPGEVRLDEAAARLLGNDAALAPGEPVEFTLGVREPTHVLRAEGELAEASAAAVEPAAAALEATVQRSAPAALASTMMGSGDGAAPVAAAPGLAEGTLFDGRYRIEERIGSGGMAIVYRARHVSLSQARAIKIVNPARLAAAGAVEQFRRETEATARLRHPNVVQLHDFGRSLEGLYYLALDYVEGQSLADLLREGPMRTARALGIALDILAGLQAAHELRLVHRDLKPANVLIDRDGRVRVTDFGMVQPLFGGIDPHADLIVGTPAYMSPEQCQGRPLDGRSDLYSFGVTLYQMVSGALPYSDLSSQAVATAAVEQDIVPLEVRAPELSPALTSVIEQCLRKDATERPASALLVQRELRVLALAGDSAAVA